MSSSIDELVAALDAEIPEAMRQREVPGLALGICDPDGPLWSSGYGTTARDGGADVTCATRFSVQSTSKLVTATAVLVAVARGLVELDAPVTRYLPDFTVHSVFDEDPGSLITLRHLLNHTAGFTHEAPVGSNHDLGTGDFEAHCASIRDTWLRFPVGHHHEYSNLGIDVAGWILQRVGGETFADYVERELFAPLGMTRSTFDPAVYGADDDRAVGHWRPFRDAGLPLPVEVPMVAAGGLYTTVEDALRFAGFHLGSGAPLLPADVRAQQFRVPSMAPGQELGYGLGVYVDAWEPGVAVRHHGGSGFGFQCQFCWAPDVPIGVVVLTNSFDHSLQNEIARRVIGWAARRRGPAAYTGIGRPTQPVPDETYAGDGADLAGEYIGRNDDLVEVVADADGLRVHGAQTYRARPTGPRTITLDSPARDRYRFAENRHGGVAYLVDERDGTVRYRNDAAATPPSVLDPARAGTYTVRSWGVPTGRFRLRQAGDSPVVERFGDEPGRQPVAVRLAPIGPDTYLSSTGEVLDLTRPTPTYANIALHRVDATADADANPGASD